MKQSIFLSSTRNKYVYQVEDEKHDMCMRNPLPSGGFIDCSKKVFGAHFSICSPSSVFICLGREGGENEKLSKIPFNYVSSTNWFYYY